MNSFDFVVGSNMDELFDKVSEIGKVPFPLLTSSSVNFNAIISFVIIMQINDLLVNFS